MKKILFLILLSVTAYGQVPADATPIENIQLTNNVVSTGAPSVAVQETNGVINKINKADLIEYLEFASAVNLPVTGVAGKLYLTRDNNRLYRWNGTVYSDVTTDITGKEDTANKTSSFATSSTTTYPNSKALSDGLATKIGGSGTTNFIPKFAGSGTIGDSSIFETPSGVIGIGTATPSAYFGKTVEIAGANGGSLVLKGSSVEAVLFTNNGGGSASFGTNTNHPLDVSVNGLPKARFHTDNSLTINTITNNGQGALQVNGNITANPATLSNQVVVKSQLDLKADLASPSLTGTPTAPTAPAGTNTTQIATTAFVTSVDNGNVKLTGTQTISNGQKTFTNTATGATASIRIENQNEGIGQFINNNNLLANSLGLRIDTNLGRGLFINANGSGNGSTVNSGVSGTGFNYVGQNNGTNTFTVDKLGVVTLVGGTSLNNAVPRSQLSYTNQTITANKTVTIAEFVNNNELILSVDATSGNITITLPTFTALQGYKVTVKKMDSSANSVLITGVGGVNIDGSASVIISGQYSSSTVGANLSQYIIL